MDFYRVRPEFQDRIMLLDDAGRNVTYGEFERFSENAGKILCTRQVMVIFCENVIGSVMMYLSCLNNGIVPLLLDKNMDHDLAQQLILRYDPGYIAVSENVILADDRGMEELILNEYGYKVFRRASQSEPLIHKDLALLLTTSGSTGSPKLVRQSYKNINSNAERIAQYLELTESERPITILPMSYTYGLSIINSHLLVGATILLTGYTLFQKEFWEFFKKENATSISGVPYTYEMLKRLRFCEMELPSLRTMTQAGGKLSEKLHREMAEYALHTGRKFVVMYGQTEATARMGYLPPEKALEKCGSMGIAIPGGTFFLMDGEREISEPDIVGELVYKGDNVTMGYALCSKDLQKGDENQGILYTGDMAKRDADGYYYIVGRKKRFLKMFGKRVNLDEAEQLLKEAFPGVGIACLGEDDCLQIYMETADKTLCETAARWLAERTGIHERGILANAIERIPKNEAGKTLYSALKGKIKII